MCSSVTLFNYDNTCVKHDLITLLADRGLSCLTECTMDRSHITTVYVNKFHTSCLQKEDNYMYRPLGWNNKKTPVDLTIFAFENTKIDF